MVCNKLPIGSSSIVKARDKLKDNIYIKKEGRHPDDQSSNFKNLIP